MKKKFMVCSCCSTTLTRCLILLFVSDDEFPTRICPNCLKKLKDAYAFQQVIVKSRKELVQLLKDSKQEGPPEEGEETTFFYDESVSFEPCMEAPSEPETSSNVTTVSSVLATNNSGPVFNKQLQIKCSKLTKFDCGLCNKGKLMNHTHFVVKRKKLLSFSVFRHEGL